MSRKKHTSPTTLNHSEPKVLIETTGNPRPFLGLVPFSNGRNQVQGVLAILEVCLDEPKELFETDWNYVETRLARANLSYRSLWELCEKSWFDVPKNSHHVLVTLQNQGYGGNLIDLWETVHGISPSQYALRSRVGQTNRATTKTKRRQQAVGPHWNSNIPAGTLALNTSQFRRLLQLLSCRANAPTAYCDLNDAEIDARLRHSGLNASKLRMFCQRDWKLMPVYCERVFDILWKAGYGGSMEDLWIAVCGRDSLHLLPRIPSSKKVYRAIRGANRTPKAAIVIRTRWIGKPRSS